MELRLEDFDFDPTQPIGRGGFGEVFKARCRNLRGLPPTVALKKVKKTVAEYKIRQECDLLKQLNNNNIVKCYDYFKDARGSFYIVMELCEYGNLREYIKARRRLAPAAAAAILKQLVCALVLCHRKDILHRDLSAGNVLIFREPIQPDDSTSAPRVKLTDFGLARELERNMPAQTFAGTPGYMPPEMHEGTSYTKMADVYALGSLLYFMLTGKEPTGNVEANTRDPLLTDEAAELIAQLQAPESRRIPLGDVLRSTFMNANGVTSTITSLEGRSRSRDRAGEPHLFSSGIRRRDGSSTSRDRHFQRIQQPDQGHLRQRAETRSSDGSSRGQTNDSGFRSGRNSSVPPAPRPKPNRPESVASGHKVKWPIDVSRLLRGKETKELRNAAMRVIVTRSRVTVERVSHGFVDSITRITFSHQQKVEFLHPARHDLRLPREDGQPPIEADERRGRTYTSLSSLSDAEMKQYSSMSFVLWQMGFDCPRVTTRHPFFPWAHCRLMENGDMRIVPNSHNQHRDKLVRKMANGKLAYKSSPNNDNGRSSDITDQELISRMEDIYQLLLNLEGVALDFGIPFPLSLSSPVDDSKDMGSVVIRSSSSMSNVRASTASAPSVLTRATSAAPPPDRSRPPLRAIQEPSRPAERPPPPPPPPASSSKYRMKQLKPGEPFYSVEDVTGGRRLRMSSSPKTPHEWIYRRCENAPEMRFDWRKGPHPPGAEDLVEQLRRLLKI